MIRLRRIWLHRYELETGPCITERKILTPEDIAGIQDPTFVMADEHVSKAVRNLLRRNRAWFDMVEQQLQSMLQVWNTIVQQKQRFDDSKGRGPISSDREFLEALLLAGRFIPARTSLVPHNDSRGQRDEKPENAPSGSVRPLLMVDAQKKR